MSGQDGDKGLLETAILRREFFAILGVCTASAKDLVTEHGGHLAETASDFGAYRPRAFTPPEYELLDILADTLLPADETGPGAHDAHVAYYIDVVLTHSAEPRLLSWKSGLVGIEGLVHGRYQKGFVECSSLERQEIFSEFAKNEMAPRADMDRFFVDFKRTVIDGFYASELIRHEHLGYRGDTAIAEFAGCRHANFEHSDVA